MKQTIFILMAGVMLLAACAPAPAPTQDPAVVQQQIQEAVALTVAAQNVQTEQAQALIPEPTNTPLPTQTEPASPTPILPTATPFVVVPPTLTPAPVISSGGGSAPAKLEYDCTVGETRPYDNTVFKPSNEFDIRWTITNTGTKSWPAGMDVKYYSGPQLSPNLVVELPAMDPGDSYVVILDGKAPSNWGFYVMTYIVEGKLCFPYIAINVE